MGANRRMVTGLGSLSARVGDLSDRAGQHERIGAAVIVASARGLPVVFSNRPDTVRGGMATMPAVSPGYFPSSAICRAALSRALWVAVGQRSARVR